MDANNTINTTITPDAIDGTAAASIASAAGAYAQFAMQAASLVAGQDGQLVLPEGVSLSDIRVSGRNLIVRMPDGSEVVIEDGAIVIPQFVVDGVAIPAINLAALLVGQEPAPAAGPTQSSGGNFEQDPGTIGDPFGLGDLLPPTQLAFSDPQPEEQLPGLIDRDPDVNIQDGGPAGKDVTDNVSEVGLPGTRTNGNVESPGSSAGNGSDSTTGFIIVNSPDGIASITINGATYTGVAGQQIVTANGVLTLGVLSGDQIPYTYRLTDNTSGDSSTDVFTVVLTDPDGDTSTARLTIVIADDVPTARADTDSVAGGTFGPESGNVLSGTGTTSGAAGADTLGADGAAVSGFRAGASGSFAAVGTTIAGQYGTLTLGANGSYTYVRNPNTPGGVSDVFTYQITDGDGDASTATLTINIGDAPNRITFVPEIGEGTEVRESHLPARDGEPSGSQFDGNSETTSGTITFTSPDGVGSVTVSGVTLTPGSLPQTVVSNATGTLVVTGYTYNPTTGVGSITYTYTLNDNTLNTSGSTVSFPVVVTDLDGDAASDQLDIRIVDDVPTAANDADSIAAGQYGPATGNVITDAEGDGGADVKGADNATVTAVSGAAAGTVGGSTAGQYGVLTLNADGSYSYVRNAGTPGGVTDVFSYTITDGDGDPSTATLTISIADSPTTLDLPTEGEAGTQVNENGLPAGSAAATNNELTSGTIAYTAPDGPASVTIDGVAITAVGQTFTGSFGTLTITSIANGVIGYDYLLTTNTSGNATFDDFAVVVTDKDGDSTPGTLTINIVDDVPTARADVDSVTEDGPIVADGNVITGANVADANATDGVADTQGADGATVTAVAFGATSGTVGSALTGNYGSLTLNADGSYSYTLNNADPAIQGLDKDDSLTEVFSYTITDGDGDPSTTTLTITINGNDDPITINGLSLEGPDLIVDEDDLADGSSPNAPALLKTGTFTVNGLDGIASVKIEGTETFVGQQFTTAYGTFTITSISAPADGNSTAITIGYSYELTDNAAHSNAGGQNFLTELFDVEVTDTDGSTDTDQVEVRIIDDVPSAADDTDTMSGGNYGPVTGNVITDASAGDAADGDNGADTPGADGVTVISVSSVNVPANSDSTVDGSGNYEVNGQYGVLTIAPDGSYSYIRNPGTPGDVTDTFNYVIRDADGDLANANLTISVRDSGTTLDVPTTGEAGTSVSEVGLPARGTEPEGSGEEAAAGANGDTSEATSGTITFTAPDGPAVVTIEGKDGPITISAAGQTVNGLSGVLTVNSYNAVSGTITYTYVLTDNTSGDATGETFIVKVQDADDDSTTLNLVIDITDDTPIARADTDGAVEGGTASGNVLTGTGTTSGAAGADTPGADGFAAGGGVVGVKAGNDTSTPVTTGAGTAITGLYGTLTLNADGSYSYAANANAVTADANDVFVYTVRDGDGDMSTTTLTINVANVTVTATDTDALVNEAGLATGSDPSATSEVFNGSITPAGGVGGYTYALTGSATGTYGSLVLNPNGTYTYTLNAAYDGVDANNGTNTEQDRDSFGYSVTDANGNTTTGTILVDIIDDVPVAQTASVEGTVDEDGLTGGNTADAAGDAPGADLIATGSITSLFTAGADTPLTYSLSTDTSNIFSAPLALSSGGVALTYAVVGNLLTASAGATPVFTLELNATTGDWTFTLLAKLDHPDGSSENDIFLDFGEMIVATDNDGDIATGTGNLFIRIDDDSPSAFAETARTVAEDAVGTIDGNVLTNDAQGADGAVVTHVNLGSGFVAITSGTLVSGAYQFSTPKGVYTFKADGSWTFDPANNQNNASGIDASFSYRITDADGDVSEAVQPITITDGAGPSAGDPLTLALDDQNLADGTTSANPDFASGTVSFTAGSDALTSFAFAANIAGLDAGLSWTRVSDTLIEGRDGANLIVSLTLTPPASIAAGGNGTATVTATLHDNYDSHPTFTSDDLVNLGSVGVVASDQDGDSATATVNVTVSDDVPTARADTDGADEGSSTIGNVLTGTGTTSGAAGADTPGADGFAAGGGVVGVKAGNDTSTPVTTGAGTAITGLYGTLTLNADGSYSYDGNPDVISAAQTDVFVYTVRDGDGDMSTTTLTINLTPVTLVADNDTVTVNEAGLDLVNDAGPDTVAGTVNGSNPTSDSDVATGALSVAGATGYTLSGSGTGSYGTLVLNSDGTYSYTLTRPFDTTPDNNNGVTTETGKDVFTYTATDANGNSITGTITVDIIDDVPTATATAVPGSIAAVDETATNSTASTLGITNIGDDPDVAGSGRIAVATTSGAVVTAGGIYGADGANAVDPLIYGLVVTNAVSGLFVTDGAAINLVQEGDLVVGRVASGTFAGKAAFAISINSTTGQVTVEQYLSLDHPLNPNPDDLVSLAAGSLGATVTRTDGDGDQATSTAADISGQITFADDGPTITTTVTDPLVILNDSTPSATGDFVFSTGADGAKATNDAISISNFTVTVNDVTATGINLIPGVEDATFANYSFTFQYPIGTGGTATANGTLVFNKLLGNYTVELTNGPIQGVTIDQTSDADTTFVEASPQVTTAALDTNLFAQFTGMAEPGSGTGADNLRTIDYDPNPAPPNPSPEAAPGTWTAGELFNQVASTVQVSSAAAGVGGNTIQGGEVLDFNLYSSNPGGTTGALPSASASAMFLKFDTIGSGEDMIVVLKLWQDTNGNGLIETTDQFTTRALLIQNSDIIKSGPLPSPYQSITLDNNDGIVFIEPNDYNAAGENWAIVGAQIVGSDEDVGGMAINFVSATGTGGASNVADTSTYQAFQLDTGDSPFKISSIGFVRQTTQNQSATIEFDVTVTDGDGDTVTRTGVTVNIDDGTPPVVLDLDGDGAEFLSTAAGVAFDYLGDGNPESTAWVGADDGLLAIDSNGNGLVDNGSEIVFGGNGLTDLQGLAANYDSNKDGVLDANDADFAKFGVWQDANSNGVTDAGEFRSLTDAGITSINLVSDGVEYAAANGEVTVHGTSSYTKADGTTGEVADASFATAGESKVAANENDQRVLASANTGMASSLVAAGLVAAIAGSTENTNSLHEQIGGSEFVTRTVSENPADFAEIEAPDHAGLLNDTSGAAGVDAADLIGSAKFSSYDQVEDHADANFGGFGEMDSGSLLSDLLASTEIEHANFAQTGFAIGSHVDAASEALIAIQQGDMFAKAAIEEVVADALAGGFGEGANVDALLNALAGPANDTLLLGDTLAQQFGDHPAFEALNFAAANDMLDQLASTHMELSAATGQHG